MEAAAIQGSEIFGHGLLAPGPLFLGIAGRARAGCMSDSQKGGGVPEDREFVERILASGGESYEELVSRYKGKVIGTASRFARNTHDLDDLVQEVFLRIWRGLGKYRGEAPLEHWVMRVAVRTCYDFLRRNRRRRENEVLVENSDRGSVDGRAEEGLRSRDAWEIVQAGMRKLDARERLILTLMELEERPVAEVSELTGWSASNVKVRAFRARKKLREVLERENLLS